MSDNFDIRSYRGFKPLSEQHRYDSWKVLFTGYDYKDTLLKRSLSPYLYKNPTTAGFLDMLNKMVVYLVNLVKYIRNYFNYAVPKDYDKIN